MKSQFIRIVEEAKGIICYLTERKANNIKQFLVNKGIDESRLSAKGYGRFLFKDCQDCNECINEKVEIANGLVEIKIL
ncbi:MAG: hypothetical protein COZ18_06580 [Flexibacter sp. CG_4_10_14_3_um_filter_32_15]|nr:MAG: hypothetical protein COZ18_06580 [Flexibacter sp. CG_4_10_14_3_um_filter_32_15]